MKVRLKLKQRQIEDGQRPVGFDHAIYRLVERLPARTVRSVATEVDEDAADQIWGNPHIPDYNALAAWSEKVRRERLGYPVDDVDNVVEDDPDEDERPVPPTMQRRKPLFPGFGAGPLSADDFED